MSALESLRQSGLIHMSCLDPGISWSLPVEGTLGDYSLLAIGHKSGHVSLWRYASDAMGFPFISSAHHRHW